MCENDGFSLSGSHMFSLQKFLGALDWCSMTGGTVSKQQVKASKLGRSE